MILRQQWLTLVPLPVLKHSSTTASLFCDFLPSLLTRRKVPQPDWRPNDGKVSEGHYPWPLRPCWRMVPQCVGRDGGNHFSLMVQLDDLRGTRQGQERFLWCRGILRLDMLVLLAAVVGGRLCLIFFLSIFYGNWCCLNTQVLDFQYFYFISLNFFTYVFSLRVSFFDSFPYYSC